ncbi:MAG: anti-sigma factor [Candidatus Omnitrophota bacterium]
MNHEQWLEQAESYALGSLEDAERLDFENHLPRCAFCQARVRETEELLSSLPRSLSPVTPPAGLKNKIMEGIGAEAALPRAGAGVWRSLAGIVVFTIVAIVLLSLPLTKTSIKPPTMVHDTAMIQVLTSPETLPVELKGLDTESGASATFVWNPRLCRGCFVVKNLAAIPAGKVFQLWAIAGKNAPVSVGTFTTDASGAAHMDFPALSEVKPYDKFAVTLEPAGGVLQPTGPMHLLGTF